MAPNPWRGSLHDWDDSARFLTSSTVVASPATNSETVIASITGIDLSIPIATGVGIFGWCAFTVGTSGASYTLRIRTGTTAGSGTVIVTSGAVTRGISAGVLCDEDIQGFDTTITAGGPDVSSYCMTLTIGSGAATSTVSAVSLFLDLV